MANSIRGQVVLKTPDKEFVLRYTADALCQLETVLDKSFGELILEIQNWGPNVKDGKIVKETPDQVLARAKKIRITTLRAVLWAGLIDSSPNMTLRDAGEIMMSVGGPPGVLPDVMKAFSLAFPSDDEIAEPGQGEGTSVSPPQAQPDGTGSN